jgi:7,8-dihydro-6-hydroxymethylpterin-pyrophosphokinase
MNELGPSAVAYISVGSNIEPHRNIEAGLRALLEYVTVIGISMHYLSRPTTRPEQQDFINGVWKIQTDYAARSLLHGDLVIQSPGLTLPEPNIYTAPYIAVPLAELALDLVLPDTGLRMGDLDSAKRREGLSPLPDLTELLKGWLNK